MLSVYHLNYNELGITHSHSIKRVYVYMYMHTAKWRTPFYLATSVKIVILPVLHYLPLKISFSSGSMRMRPIENRVSKYTEFQSFLN